MDIYDVVIVGAGPAGGALATALARNGLDVLLLEQQASYRDRVLGEVIVPWGVHEATECGLRDVLDAADPQIVKRLVVYDEALTPEAALSAADDVTEVFPGVPGVYCVGHPALTQAFAAAFEQAGGTFLRPAKYQGHEVDADGKVSVSFDHHGSRHATAHLLVGADGRQSSIAKSLGVRMHSVASRLLFAGMLARNLGSLPRDQATTAYEGDRFAIAWPQRPDHARLYHAVAAEDRHRYKGAGRQREFLDDFRAKCLPYADDIADAEPAGPCAVFPVTDTWPDAYTASGVVLLGDAAGCSNPIMGLGLSLCMRDARLLSELLLSGDPWSRELFISYASDRSLRLRRLRQTADLFVTFMVEFDERAKRRRAVVRERFEAEPDLSGVFSPLFAGPYAADPVAFADDTSERLYGGMH